MFGQDENRLLARLHPVQVFVRIRNGKIWVEEDWTETGIADVLIEKGVVREQMVLGFQHPTIRKLTEFAAV